MSTSLHGLSSDFPHWIQRVNDVLTKKEADAVKLSIERNRPFGTDDWVQSTAERLGLESTIRNRGRPKKLA